MREGLVGVLPGGCWEAGRGSEVGRLWLCVWMAESGTTICRTIGSGRGGPAGVGVRGSCKAAKLGPSCLPACCRAVCSPPMCVPQPPAPQPSHAYHLRRRRRRAAPPPPPPPPLLLRVQMQADILQVPVRRPAHLETTSLGAALAAGIGAGVWTAEEAFVDLKHNTGGWVAGRAAPGVVPGVCEYEEVCRAMQYTVDKLLRSCPAGCAGGTLFEPQITRTAAERRHAKWKLVVQRSFALAGVWGDNTNVLSCSRPSVPGGKGRLGDGLTHSKAVGCHKIQPLLLR